MENRTYIAIDLKSFYASVECVERGLNPLTTHLVVADPSRTDKTICLAVSPSLKAYGISGRARMFEVVQKEREINRERLEHAPGHVFAGESCDAEVLAKRPDYELSYLVAPPHMAKYIKHSTQIYNIYLKYVAPEDIHVYSIDEVFMDVTDYLNTYKVTAHGLAMTIMLDVLKETGITATAGIGPNLYLCKIAMDVEAKHIAPDENGVRIAELDEISYRKKLWEHEPITDFWRIGSGYAKKLAKHGMYTMGDVARCSIGKPNEYHNEKLLYDLFGVNAELLIDHAWGWEPCTIPEIKAYRPKNNSICSGQVLTCPYEFSKARIVASEMADMLALDLVEKQLVTDQIVLTVGYDIENLKDPDSTYKGEIKIDHYGRKIPKHAHGTVRLNMQTSSSRKITEATQELFDRIVDKKLLIRRISITAGSVVREDMVAETYQQLDLFSYQSFLEKQKKEKEELEKEKKLQQAMLEIKKKFGKNAILKGMNLEEGATAKQRNEQIGGHKM